PSLYDDKVPAAPATDVKNIRYPEILLLEKNGTCTLFNRDIGQQATENCFKPDTKVILETGEAVTMSLIVVGDKVCVGVYTTHSQSSHINKCLFRLCKERTTIFYQFKVLSGNHIVPVRVASVCTETHNGYIAPFTITSIIVADNVIMCSCYATCAPYQETIHAMLTPLRFKTWFKKSTHTGKEIHSYLGFLYNI
ncbi:8658_t:CDS:2, partial [Scutellospora calospora]